MAKLDDEPDFVKCLYYGYWGTGKTTNLAHMAKLGPVQYVRPDRGLHAKPLRLMGVPTDRINVVTELRPASLEQSTVEWAEALEAKPGSIAGICLDTATELVARRIEHEVDQAWERTLKDARRKHTEPDRTMRYFVDRDYYQPVTQEVTRLVRHWADLPCHVAIACQMRRDEDKSGKVDYSPNVNPAVQGNLIGYMGLVIRTETDGYYEDGEQVFVGHPRRSEGYIGKDQYNALPRILANPTFDRAVGYVLGDLDFKTDPIQARYRDLVAKRKKDDEL
jgi:hypothetical protein